MKCDLYPKKTSENRDLIRKAVEIDPDFGDAWAYWYKFERVKGTKEQQAEVLRQCVAASPRHGKYWRSVSKNIKNWRSSCGEILKNVAVTIPF